MDKSTAEQVASRRGGEDGTVALWGVREVAAGDWQVVRLSVPGATPTGPRGAHAESRPRPEAPLDPRPTSVQNIPPYGAGW